MTAARLPVVKDLERFSFDGNPINEEMIRSLHDGSFLPSRRNIVLVGGTGTGKTHLAIAIRSEEHTSELQSLMRISYAVFCLKKKTHHNNRTNNSVKRYRNMKKL